ncbi:hypothetical protein K438DRAFT_1749162 [Mycena galopus ATCC 62051]|nr:hypothetical protein K438DRAFT_1749162 [Mycena galopus ATCC 62051]
MHGPRQIVWGDQVGRRLTRDQTRRLARDAWQSWQRELIQGSSGITRPEGCWASEFERKRNPTKRWSAFVGELEPFAAFAYRKVGPTQDFHLQSQKSSDFLSRKHAQQLGYRHAFVGGEALPATPKSEKLCVAARGVQSSEAPKSRLCLPDERYDYDGFLEFRQRVVQLMGENSDSSFLSKRGGRRTKLSEWIMCYPLFDVRASRLPDPSASAGSAKIRSRLENRAGSGGSRNLPRRAGRWTRMTGAARFLALDFWPSLSKFRLLFGGTCQENLQTHGMTCDTTEGDVKNGGTLGRRIPKQQGSKEQGATLFRGT